jgi:hypothetical protein
MVASAWRRDGVQSWVMVVSLVGSPLAGGLISLFERFAARDLIRPDNSARGEASRVTDLYRPGHSLRTGIDAARPNTTYARARLGRR